MPPVPNLLIVLTRIVIMKQVLTEPPTNSHVEREHKLTCLCLIIWNRSTESINDAQTVEVTVGC